MKRHEQQSKPLTTEALLNGRRYEELSAAEQKVFGDLHRQEATAEAEAIAANLNRNVEARNR